MAKLVRRVPYIGVLRCQKWSYHTGTSVQTQILNQRNVNRMGSQGNLYHSQAIPSRSTGMDKLHGLMTQLEQTRILSRGYRVITRAQIPKQTIKNAVSSEDEQHDNQASSQVIGSNAGVRKHQIGENVSRKDKIKFLTETLLDIKDSKEAIYGALDAWVAWEQNFPIGPLKRVIFVLEKEGQWHRIVQVIKWMLSKGQGTTRGTYGQLIRALDMDHRAEEAHQVWVKKIGNDLHSVPWQLCRLMVGVYYRNNMLENLIKLFKGLEDFDRKPPEKSIVQRVADAYEMLGRMEEKEQVLEKYKDLFAETWKGSPKKSRGDASKKKKRRGKDASTSDAPANASDGMQTS